jgi:hypothetical protein
MPLVIEHRGVWSLNVEIAHIRSASSTGPRHDPNYPNPDDDENLLLLCHQHHNLIDDHPQVYPVDELVEWREKQIRQEGGSGLDESQIKRIVDAILEVRATVDLVGVIETFAGDILVPIEDLNGTESLNFGENDRFLGVNVANSGSLALQVKNVGVDISLVDSQNPLNYQFPTNLRFGRPKTVVPPQGSDYWAADLREVAGGFLEALKHGLRTWPDRFRGYALLGTGDRIEGDWVDIIHLPIWRPDLTSEGLQEMFREAKRRGISGNRRESGEQ